MTEPARQAPFRLVMTEDADGWVLSAETTSAERSLLFRSDNRMSEPMVDQVISLLLSIRDPAINVDVVKRPLN